ncbi:MAG: NIPSNAP family protein [Bacteroidota bacterium]
MLRNYLFLLLLPFFACETPSGGSAEAPADSPRDFYQLKVYQFDSEAQQSHTDEYLASAYLPALKRLKINSVGVFKNLLSEEDSVRKTYVLIPFSSMEQFAELEDKLFADQAHLDAGKAYLEAAHDEPPYQRIESMVLRAFADMPVMSPSPVEGPRAERIYELRSYEAATEELYRRKVDMFNAGGEIKLFERLGFNAVFYAEVLSGPKTPNLMYMTTFDNRETRDGKWKEFVADPEWETLKAVEKYQNTVSHADIMLLYPTDYSDY